jgi:hypothetical protein
MFDHFSAFNAQRVAHELVDSLNKTKPDSAGKPVDIRWIALGIAMGVSSSACVTTANFENFAPPAAISKLLTGETLLDGTIPKTFAALQADTQTRQQTLDIPAIT